MRLTGLSSPRKRNRFPESQTGRGRSSGIDFWILDRLEKEGLKPSPEASRPLLLRRLSLDLRGLPPTLEEIERFVADRSSDAYERAVDRLLADPAFGERWARMWLDQARYADSAGYGSDPLRPSIWRYRDWVIGAFNRNLPFDQFTLWQIAGDLLPDATLEQKIATAFHRNTMTNTEGGTDDEEFRVAAIKDRVDTTMQVFMGLTMGCAKCHSHKFDPITHEEYYKFYAIFNQTADNDQPDESPVIAAPTPEIAQRVSVIRRSDRRTAEGAGERPREARGRASEVGGHAPWSRHSRAEGRSERCTRYRGLAREQADQAAGSCPDAVFRIDRAGAGSAARPDRRARESTAGESRRCP